MKRWPYRSFIYYRNEMFRAYRIRISNCLPNPEIASAFQLRQLIDTMPEALFDAIVYDGDTKETRQAIAEYVNKGRVVDNDVPYTAKEVDVEVFNSLSIDMQPSLSDISAKLPSFYHNTQLSWPMKAATTTTKLPPIMELLDQLKSDVHPKGNPWL